METITYGKITAENFFPTSLDGFVRRQEVHECWRKVDGQWTLLPIAYVKDWDLEERRSARESGASRLYISAHSARESIAAYRKYGCVEAEEMNQLLAEKEPCDAQMEFRL